jgi:pilus assembly protein CpaE
MPSGEKIRVLIVDDVSETRENVRKLLQFESDVDVVGVARTGRSDSALSRLESDVVLMDINMPDMDGIARPKQFAQQQLCGLRFYPFRAIRTICRAMLAGARISHQAADGRELISAIRRAGLMAQSERSKSVRVQQSRQ